MKDYFQVLDPQQYSELTDVIALITLYVGEADGTMDHEESEWAKKVTKIRSYNLEEELKSYYTDVGSNFDERLTFYKSTLPSNPEERKLSVEAKLANINDILEKLHPMLAAALYKSFKSFAKHVAKASGGLLGFFSIGPKESELIKLSMLNEIEYNEDQS